jgi:tripartite tricarboxylate transporter family receptor
MVLRPFSISLRGRVQVIFDNLPTSLEYIRAGKVRPLAVTTGIRSDALPDLPTVSKFVPGYEVSSWFGIGLPSGTPTEIIETLNSEINAGLADPKLKAQVTGEPPRIFRRLFWLRTMRPSWAPQGSRSSSLLPRLAGICRSAPIAGGY